TPIAAGHEVMTYDGWGGPGNVYKGLLNESPIHQQIGGSGEDQGVEDVRNHEDRIEDDGESEKDGFVDLKNLSGEGEPADFAEAGVAGIEHEQREGDGGAGAADVDE